MSVVKDTNGDALWWEVKESRSLHRSRSGKQGETIYYCQSAFVDAYLPVMITAFPYNPDLRIVDISNDWDHEAKSCNSDIGYIDYDKVVASWSTMPKDEEEPKISIRMSATCLDVGNYAAWADGTLIGDAQSTLTIPQAAITVELGGYQESDLAKYSQYVGYTNSHEWRGYPAETVEYLGAETSWYMDMPDLVNPVYRYRLAHSFVANNSTAVYANVNKRYSTDTGEWEYWYPFPGVLPHPTTDFYTVFSF